MAAPIVVFLAAGDNDIAAAAATSENEQELEGEVRGRNPTNKMARGGRAGGRGNPRPPTDSLGGTGAALTPSSSLAGGDGGSKLLFSPHFGIGVEERVVALGWSGVGRDLVRMSRCFPILFSVPSPLYLVF